MSRLEKAREEKRKRRKKSSFILLLFLITIAAIGTLYFLGIDYIIDTPEETVTEIIDLERSNALIDIFELTYVRVYTLDGLVADEIRVNGEPLEKSVEENRWEITLSDLKAGNEIFIVAVLDGRVVQEESLVVEEL